MAGRNIELQQYAEWNISRLGLIPAQSRLPQKYRMGWKEIRGDEGSNASVECFTGHESGVPYGVASDTIAALMTLAIALAQQKDAEGQIRTTLEELGKMTFLREHIGGKQYHDLLTALNAMAYTKYTVTNKWRTLTHKNQSFAVFSLINSFGVAESIQLQGEVKKNIYYIDLNELLWKSATGGLTLTLDPQLLSAVDSPTTRAIYRMLEAYRYSDNMEQPNSTLSMRAIEFADAARLLSTGSAISDRLASLTRKNGAFEQLKREGYLKNLEITGRGDNTMLYFHFSQENTIIHTNAARLLIQQGVVDSHAQKLAQQFTSEEVECAIWLTERAIAKQRGGKNEIKNPAGFIIKLLTSGDAQNHKDEYKNSLKSKTSIYHPIKSIPIEEESDKIIIKTAKEYLKDVLNIKRLSLSTSNALQKAVAENLLTADQVRSLLFAVNVEEQALKLLELKTE